MGKRDADPILAFAAEPGVEAAFTAIYGTSAETASDAAKLPPQALRLDHPGLHRAFVDVACKSFAAGLAAYLAQIVDARRSVTIDSKPATPTRTDIESMERSDGSPKKSNPRTLSGLDSFSQSHTDMLLREHDARVAKAAASRSKGPRA